MAENPKQSEEITEKELLELFPQTEDDFKKFSERIKKEAKPFWEKIEPRLRKTLKIKEKELQSKYPQRLYDYNEYAETINLKDWQNVIINITKLFSLIYKIKDLIKEEENNKKITIIVIELEEKKLEEKQNILATEKNTYHDFDKYLEYKKELTETTKEEQTPKQILENKRKLLTKINELIKEHDLKKQLLKKEEEFKTKYPEDFAKYLKEHKIIRGGIFNGGILDKIKHDPSLILNNLLDEVTKQILTLDFEKNLKEKYDLLEKKDPKALEDFKTNEAITRLNLIGLIWSLEEKQKLYQDFLDKLDTLLQQ